MILEGGAYCSAALERPVPDSNTVANSVEQNIIVVATNKPHRESAKVLAPDESPFCFERRCIIV